MRTQSLKNTKMRDSVRSSLKMVRIPSPYLHKNRIESSDERHESRFHGTRFRYFSFGDGKNTSSEEARARRFRVRRLCHSLKTRAIRCTAGIPDTTSGTRRRRHSPLRALVVVRGDTKRRGDVSRSRVATFFFSPLFLVRDRIITKETQAFLLRLFAELVVEILAALDDEPRERALRVARADGVALGHAPVLALHVLLRVESGAASGERA